MRLRSNHVLPPISEYVPRRRRRTRSASAQAGTESATESAPEIAQEAVPESQSASDVAEQSAAERPAPRRKPAKRAGRKKKAAAKGKKAAAPTAESEAEPQEDPVTLIPSVEQPDARTLPPKLPPKPKDPPRTFRGRLMTAFRWGSARDLLRREQDYEPTPSPPQTPVTHYAWPPGITYSKRRRIPWSLPWTPPPPWRNWPRRLAIFNTPDESVLTPAEEPTRKRNRSSEDDEDPSSKRHKLTLQTPPGFENRPRGSSRRTYAERARRREAERNGRIDRTIYRFPQLLAQQGEDARSGNSTALASDASEEPASRGNRIVPFASSPSALPQDQNQNQNQNRLGWREWIFNSVTGLWGRGNVPQTAQVPQVAEPQRPIGNEPSSSVATPSLAPPSSAVLPRNLESPTPRPRVAEPQTSNSRLTASARAPQAGKRKKYSYDLDPQGFDPELLARMRARKSNPAALQPPPTSPQQPDTLSENESKKRKREPSPDVIPHPPGCSYGFDPQYFIYDIDDEDLTAGEQAGQDTTPKRATVCGASEKEHASKRARQDITPKRATGSIAAEEEPIPKHAIPDNTHLHNLNHQGPSKLMDDSSEELRKARQLAEQYKPKTPSRLRAALRFESSWSSYVDEEADQDAVRRRKMRKTSMATACPTGDLTEILWPEEETWIDRFDWHDRNLAKYQKVFSPYAYGGDRDYFDIKHEDFMDRLAARRA